MRNLLIVAAALCSCVMMMKVSALGIDLRQAHDQAGPPRRDVAFKTAATCTACHNGLTTASGEDVSIAIDWRGSMMANSSRDPYWQAAVRREAIDHPNAVVACTARSMSPAEALTASSLR